jgi:hypothetical protein
VCYPETLEGLTCNSPGTGNAVILIGQGQYFEMVNVARSAPLVLLVSLSTMCNVTVEANTLLRVS